LLQRYLFFCSSGSNPQDFYAQSTKYNGAEGFAYSRETVAHFCRMFLYTPLPYEPPCMVLSYKGKGHQLQMTSNYTMI